MKNYSPLKNTSYKPKPWFVFAIICFFFLPLFAENIYVDTILRHDITNKKYSKINRDTTGSDGNAYKKIQTALNNMKPGDAIFMRGGVYKEGSISIPLSTSGKDSSQWSSLQSYPGEWAILDGQNSIAASNGYVLGYECMSSFDCEHHYWRFERFEVKNGRGSDGTHAVGIWISGGPFIFRYLFIHDNLKLDNGENNPSGLRSYRMQNSIVEYCYFKNNGGQQDHNCANLCIFSDYAWDGDTIHNINHTIKKNEISYCLFDSAWAGFKHKNTQLLVNYHSGTDMRYKDYGDKVHHNIFHRHKNPIMNNQDFAQIYNNISDSGTIESGEVTSSGRDRLNVTCFNNTVIHGRIVMPEDYGNMPTIFHPYYWCINNIVDSADKAWDQGLISIGLSSNTTQSIIMTDCKIDRNLIYRPLCPEHYVIGSGTADKHMGFLTTYQLNTFYNKDTNYLSSTSNLFKGSTFSNRFKTYGSFLLNIKGDSISNRGVGGRHPFLKGIYLPTYIGAVNPNADDWVDPTLNLVKLSDSVGRETMQPFVTDISIQRGIETYCDSIETITWNASDLNGIKSFTLSASTNGGKTWSLLGNCDGTKNTFTWMVPSASSPNCQIKVQALNVKGITGQGRSDFFKTICGKKLITLKYTVLSEDSVRLTLSHSLPEFVQIDSIGIFYRTDSYCTITDHSNSDSVLCRLQDSTATISRLKKKAKYYVIAFFRISPNRWETGGDSSKVSFQLPDSTPPDNNYSLQASAVDSTTISLSSHPMDKVVQDPDADSLGICYRTDHFPVKMLDKGNNIVLTQALTGKSRDTVLKDLPTNTIYYFSLFMRDSSGNWDTAKDSSKARVILAPPSAKDQSIKFPLIDTLYLFNKHLGLWSSKELSFSDIVDTINRTNGTFGNEGFLQLSSWYYFQKGTMPQTGSVGLKILLDSLPKGIPYKNIQMYRYDFNNGKIIPDGGQIASDSLSMWRSCETKNLQMYFAVLADTTKNKVVFPSDTLPFFNSNLKLFPSKDVPAYTDTMGILDSLPGVNGFIKLSPFYYLKKGIDLSTGQVEIKIKFDSLPKGITYQMVRMYRYDNTQKKIFLITDPLVLDSANSTLAFSTKNLRMPFFVMVDIVKPTITKLNKANGNLNPGDQVQDVIQIEDNIANPVISFACAAGGDSLHDFPDSIKANSSASSLYQIATPAQTINECAGYHAFVFVSDGVNTQNIDLSQAIKRSQPDCDKLAASKLEWVPLHVTGVLDDNRLASVAAAYFKPKTNWQYDVSQCRIVRWWPYESNSGSTDKWVEYGTVKDSIFSLVPSALVWFKPIEGKTIGLGTGITPSLKDTAVIFLKPHEWTDFGLPFSFRIKLKDIFAATKTIYLDSAIDTSAIDTLEVYQWEKTDSFYSTNAIYLLKMEELRKKKDTLSLGPLEGYSIFNPTSHTLQLHVPPIWPNLFPVATNVSGKLSKKQAKVSLNESWSVSVNCMMEKGIHLNPVYCGYQQSAKKGRPTYYPISPSFSPISVRVYDRQNDIAHGHVVVDDIGDGGTIFELLFDNKSDSSRVVRCNSLKPVGLPSSMKPGLFDPYNAKNTNADSIWIGPRDRTFRLLAVGTAAYLESFERKLLTQKTMLDATFPNPFTRNLKVSFTLPYTNVRQVNFEFFSLNGKFLAQKTVQRGLRPGKNVFAWNGIESSGHKLAVGMYVLKMTVHHSENNRVETFKKRLTCLQ
jgi:hypothetical protein